ncbi:MAG TPA: hypothetical protein HPP77_04160, partial [Candidatus Hydrogenedentes bacterium]|nr:hypothetical protein [Candidatus Hydrogenedentota bacterium]
ARGTIPLGWGVDPNLIETYPDIITYLYETASEHDYFVADASGAGYFNPSRVPPRHLSRLVRHNRHFFDLTDMSIAVMVLDWEQPSARVKNAYAQFAPDGYGTQLYDYHYAGGNSVAPHVWKGMPITNFFNDVCHFTSPQAAAHTMRHSLRARGFTLPAFGIWRFVYTSPTDVKETMAILSKDFPEINAEVVDPYTFFRLFKEWRLGLPE